MCLGRDRLKKNKSNGVLDDSRLTLEGLILFLCLGYFLIPFLPFTYEALAANLPEVDNISFSITPSPWDTTVSLLAKATSDPATSISSIDFTIIGISARNLVQASGFHTMPSQPAAIESALITILDEGKEFISLYEQSGQSTSTPGEFAIDLSIQGGLMDDAVFVVTAVAHDQLGEVSHKKTALLFTDQKSPTISALNLTLLTSGNNKYLSFEAYFDQDIDIGKVDFTLLGSSAKGILDVSGVLENAESFVIAKDISVGAVEGMGGTDSAQRLFSNSIMVPEGTKIPTDGVILVLAQAYDLSGNRSGMTQVFYTADIQEDMEISEIDVSPDVATLHRFGDSLQLYVMGDIAGGGKADLTKGVTGTTYISNDPTIASVTEDGLITGLANGVTTIKVTYEDFEATVTITVDESAYLTGIELGPEGLVLPHVGATAQLIVTGQFSNGSVFDLSSGRFGTEYRYIGPIICEILPDGQVHSTGVGKVTIIADNRDFSYTLEIEILDGPPAIELTCDKSSIHEGEECIIKAEVMDDLGLPGIDQVIFFLDGDPILTDEVYPFELQLQGPEQMAGKALVISAQVTDTSGHIVHSKDLLIKVTAPLDTTPPSIEIIPPTVLTAIEGVPILFRITSTEILRMAEFYVDGGLRSTERIPKFILVEEEETPGLFPGKEPEFIPVWDMVYVAPPESSGRAVVFSARGYDESGNMGKSETLIVRIIADDPPVITIGNPIDGQEVVAGCDLPIRVNVFDDVNLYGINVRFLVDEQVVHEADSSPDIPSQVSSIYEIAGISSFRYAYPIPKNSVGRDFDIRVVATDSSGNTSTTDTITVTARLNQAPQVSISSPLPGSEAVAGDQIAVRAAALDDSKIVSVEFILDQNPAYQGDEVTIGVDTDYPYEVPFAIPAESAGSTIYLYARAKDDTGLSMLSEPSQLVVVADTTKPIVTISEPKKEATVSQTENILISVGGFDDIGVTRVEVFINDTLYFTKDDPVIVNQDLNTFFASFILPSDETKAGDELVLYARATDVSSNIADSEKVRIEVISDNPPQVAIKEPLPGARVIMGSTITINANIQDDTGVHQAELYINDILEDTDDIEPFQFTYPVPVTSAQDLTIKVKAIDSAQQEAEDSVTVQAIVDIKPPLVSIIAPAQSARILANKQCEIIAATTDEVAVAEVEFYINGQYIGKDTSGESGFQIFTNFSRSYNFSQALIGQAVTIGAKAKDTAGNTSDMVTIEIMVVKDLPPGVSISYPPESTSFKEGLIIDITATLTDDNGITHLDSLSAGAVYESKSGNPFLNISLPHTLKTIVPVVNNETDSRKIGLRATDTAQNVTTEEITLNILEDDLAPRITLKAPKEGLSFLEGDSFPVIGETSDDVRVFEVDVLINGEVVSTLSQPLNERMEIQTLPNPLTFGELITKKTVYADFKGSYRIPKGIIPEGSTGIDLEVSMLARDPAGNATTSNIVLVRVIPDMEPPQVSIVYPKQGDRLVENQWHTVHAAATDNVGVTNIRIFVDGQELTYSTQKGMGYGKFLAFPVVQDTPVTISAIAHDAAGNQGISKEVIAYIVPDTRPMVYIKEPIEGDLITEGDVYDIRAGTMDDVGVEQVTILRSSGEVILTDANTNEVLYSVEEITSGTPAVNSVADDLVSGSPAVNAVTLELITDTIGATTQTAAPIISAQCISSPEFPEANMKVTLPDSLITIEEGTTAAVTAGISENSTVTSIEFQIRFGTGQDNDLVEIVEGPPYRFEFTIPSGANRLLIHILPKDADGNPLSTLIEKIRCSNVAGSLSLIWGEEGFVHIDTIFSSSSPSKEQEFVYPNIFAPIGISPLSQSITTFALDGAGLRGSVQVPVTVSFIPDTDVPVVKITNHKNGDTVVEGWPIAVTVHAVDNISLKKIYLFKNNASMGTYGSNENLGPVVQKTFMLPIPSQTDGTVITLSARAEDNMGNIGVSEKVEMNVIPDYPPSIEIISIQNISLPNGRLDNPHNQQALGGIDVLENSDILITVKAKDQAGLEKIICYLDDEPIEIKNCSGSKDVTRTVTFQIPRGTNGFPYKVSVEAFDLIGQTAEDELAIRSRSDTAPYVAFASPINEQEIAQGTFSIDFEVVAADNIAVESVTFLINGREFMTVTQGKAIPLARRVLGASYIPLRDEFGRVIPFDPQVAEAVFSFPAPFDNADPSPVTNPDYWHIPKRYENNIFLPVDLLEDSTQVILGARAKDSLGNTTLTEIILNVVPDVLNPLVSILEPKLDWDAIENTIVTITAMAGDNARVSRIEMWVGVDADNAPPEVDNSDRQAQG